MRRWATVKNYITADQDKLQRVEIYAEENKETVKADNKVYNYTRLLLVPEKSHKSPMYSIKKMSRI